MELSNEQLQNFNSINQLPYTLVSSSDTPFYTQLAIPQSFGAFQGTDLANFPNDTVQLDIYNDQDFYYETIPAASNYQINGSDIYVDLESELLNAGYDAGDFKVNIRLLRNYLGSASTIKLLVQEISPDRQEIRVIPARLAGNADSGSQAFANQANSAFADLFSTNFFAYSKAQVLSGLYVFTDALTSVEVTDYVQDRFTISSSPYSIIFKLNEPLPTTTRVNDTVWISQETNAATTETVYLVPQIKQQKLLRIKGPNFSVTNKRLLGTNTEYKAWDDLLSSNKTQTVRALLSESLVEGTPLNVDYTNFENFVKFSSAYERIKNFEYKVKLIENYQSISSSLATSTSSGSIYIQTQMSGTLGKIDAVVGAFDGFERYMYFQSSSYVSNSFGEFLDMAWPKSTSSQPYTLYGSNTAQVENWLEGILVSASLYDNTNPYNLQKLVPQHIQEQDSDVVESFINMLGHFFDVQYEYISQFTTRYDRQEKLTEGFAKELVYNLAQNLGLDFSNGLNFQDLWSYTLGLDASGSYDNTLKLSGEDRTRELWKRIINNLPYLLKTKGTERGIRALINCFGIPSTILRVKEFSGPEIDFDKASTFDHDRFYYALNVGSGNTITSPPHIVVPWSGSDGTLTGRYTPNGVSIRFKTAPFSGSIRTYNLMSWYSASIYADSIAKSQLPINTMDVGRDSSGDFVQWRPNAHLAVPSPPIKVYVPTSSNNPALFDGKWVTAYLTFNTASWTLRSASPFTGSITSSYSLYVGLKSNYSDVPLIYSASQTYTGSSDDDSALPLFSNYRVSIYWGVNNTSLSSGLNTKTLTIGSSSAPRGAVTASFSGSVQELRYWGTSQFVNNNTDRIFTASALLVTESGQLESSPFYAHVISPTTIVGPNEANPDWTGATSSFNDLVYRLNLGTDNKRTTLTPREPLSYTTFVVTSSRGAQSTFNSQVAAPLLTLTGFASASYITNSMSITTFPTGYDLYIYDRAFNGVGTTGTTEGRTVLNIFDAGYSVLSLGNDTAVLNVTGSNGTRWPIIEATAAPSNNFSWSGSKANTVPYDDLIGANWNDWTTSDGDSGQWIVKLDTRPGTNVICTPLAVSGGLQPTTSPETNTTARFIAYYAYDTVSGGRWVHINGPYALSQLPTSVLAPIRDFLLKRIDSSSLSNGTQPNQNISWLPSSSYRGAAARFVNYSGSTASYWTPVTETNYMPWPDLIGNRQTSNKIRIEDTINTSDQLYRNIKTQKSLQDTQPPDSARLGIYLSPTDQVNEDIAEQFGGISLDDFIGDYSNVYENNYKDLDALKREYAKKSSAKSNPQAYIRLLQHFNGSLFSLVKQMVPYRANLQTGLVIEPHILDRSKVRVVNRPSSEDAYYETTLDATLSADLSGDTLDLVAGIDMPQQEIEAESFEQYEGSINGGTAVTIAAKQNEYNRDQVPLQGRRLATLYSTASYDVPILRRYSLEDTIDLNTTSYGRNKNEGSKYRFLTWVTTGSGTYTGFVSNSAGFILTDSLPKPAWESTGSVILGNRKSEVYLDINGVDVFNGSGSLSSTVLTFISSDYGTNTRTAESVNNSIAKATGLRALSVSSSGEVATSTSNTHYFRLDAGGYINYRITSATNTSTGSIWFTAFPTKRESLDYAQVSFTYRGNDSTNAATMSVWFGTSGSLASPEFTASFSATTTNTLTRTLIGLEPNSDLFIRTTVSSSGAAGGLLFDNFTSRVYRYAQIQDYHVGPLASLGLRNQKYDGCKLVASDYNEDSPDTIDKGPVITIIEGPAVDLKVNPNTKGTYTFR